MRMLHRYLGYFLTGIMAVYAISGMVLIFRDTDLFKRETVVEKTLDPGMAGDSVGKSLKIRDFKIEQQAGTMLTFEGGQYDQATGQATYTVKELPFLLDRLTHLHKAKSSQPLYVLNLFFGASLLFFVISAFWMYLPKTKIFRKGLYFAAAGAALTLLLLFV
jgi:uncharacterized iron-regulated membrane protein